MALSCFNDEVRGDLKEGVANLRTIADGGQREARKLFDEAQRESVLAIERQCYSTFLNSDHFSCAEICN
jgi:hypothetical protein